MVVAKKKKIKNGYKVCEDCGVEHQIHAPHSAFCEAKTCTECGTTFGEVIEEDENGQRICDTCRDLIVSDEDFPDDDEEDDEE